MRDRACCYLTGALAGFLALPLGAARAQSVVVSWIQLGPGSSAAALKADSYGDQPASLTPTILARSIVSDGVCPKAGLDDGTAVAMRLRFSAATLGSLTEGPDAPGYFVSPTQTEAANFADGTAKATVHWAECEAVVPAGHTRISIGGAALKLPVAAPMTFLVLGDTGCRNVVKSGAGMKKAQDCNDATLFPTAYLSTYEAGFSPDLTVHVGDYLYRRKPAQATGEPWGDDFDGWNADLFYPMKTLLQAAPIILTRGNHESCGRGARGWYALLDPHPYDAKKVACSSTGAPVLGSGPNYTADFEPTYVVKAGTINFLVHDSSFADDTALNAGLAQNYDRDLTQLLNSLGPHSMNIFVTHRPSFGLSIEKGELPGTVHNWGNSTEQAVFSGGTSAASAFTHGVPASIGLFLSGHVHQAQYIDLLDSATYAPQLVVGMSGTMLDLDVVTGHKPPGDVDIPSFSETAASFKMVHFDGSSSVAVAKSAGTHDEFGFAVLHAATGADQQINGFLTDVYKFRTTKAGTCQIVLAPRSLTCDF